MPITKQNIALKFAFVLLFVALAVGGRAQQNPFSQAASLKDARHGFHTQLVPQKGPKQSLDKAPTALFRTIKYPSPAGELAAYLSPDPRDGAKHPSMLWITGGDCNSIGDVWSPAPRSNDQTAAAYRKAGIVMMFPSLRGGNTNPGVKEGFLGEVDDVLAAADFLAKQPYVDPNRIYLGGHSTGGTLAMLVTECSSRFRAVFAFGPVADVGMYGEDSGFLPFRISDRKEIVLRSPYYWLSSIHSPVWVMEGSEGNIPSLHLMRKAPHNPNTYFIEIKDVGHFATLAPTNALIAKKIVQDTAAKSQLSISVSEVNSLFQH
ncbi:MAG: Alpha/beta hydrolase family protein [Chthonomonadales bacterium]|nr:Alpha/beta hydrolase family protein [Chthonomonadales bacterium]